MGSAGGGLVEGQAFPNAFSLFLVQVLLIIALAKTVNFLLKPFKQPAVVGEMLAGIILGPTVLGRVPNFTATMFPDASVKIINVVSSFGLCFFMFLVGLELDSDKIKADLRMCLLVSATGLFVPFIASMLMALLFSQAEYVNSNTSFGILSLFLTCALGISALPVLARILSERRLLQTRLGSLSMCIAAVDDVLAWVLLAICIAVVRAGSQLDILWVFLLTVGECFLMWYVIRPIMAVVVRRGQAFTHLSADVFLMLSMVLVACCWFTEVIGLSFLIGAFQVGLLIPRNSNLSHALAEKFEYFVVGILMPLYFCNSGLRTQFGLIDNAMSVGISILLIVVATVSKVIGVTIPCWWLGIPPRISLVIGILMSCKGLIALIVVNFGIDYGLITPRFFAILVLMVLVTTMITVPLVQCVDPPSRAKQSAAETAQFEAAFKSKAEGGGAGGGGEPGEHASLVRPEGDSDVDPERIGREGAGHGYDGPARASSPSFPFASQDEAVRSAALGTGRSRGATLQGPAALTLDDGPAMVMIADSGTDGILTLLHNDLTGVDTGGVLEGDGLIRQSSSRARSSSLLGGSSSGMRSLAGLAEVDEDEGGGEEGGWEEEEGEGAPLRNISSRSKGKGRKGQPPSPSVLPVHAPLPGPVAGLPTVEEGDESMGTVTLASAPALAAAAAEIARTLACELEKGIVEEEDAAGRSRNSRSASVSEAVSRQVSQASIRSETSAGQSSGEDGQVQVPVMPAPLDSGDAPGTGSGMMDLMRRMGRSLSFAVGRGGGRGGAGADPNSTDMDEAVAAADGGGGVQDWVGDSDGEGEGSSTVSLAGSDNGEALDGMAVLLPHRTSLKLSMCISDPAQAPGLVSVVNTFCPAPRPGVSAPTRLELVWAQANVDMPSAYMNAVDAVRDIRDPLLASALSRCRFSDEGGTSAAGWGGGLGRLAVFPSTKAFEDCLEETAKGGSHFMLASHRMLEPAGATSVLGGITAAFGFPGGLSSLLGGAGDSTGPPPPLPSASPDGLVGEGAEAALRRALQSRHPTCALALLFDFSPGGLVGTPSRVLLPVEPGSRACHPALAFLGRSSAPDLEVHVLNVTPDGQDAFSALLSGVRPGAVERAGRRRRAAAVARARLAPSSSSTEDEGPGAALANEPPLSSPQQYSKPSLALPSSLRRSVSSPAAGPRRGSQGSAEVLAGRAGSEVENGEGEEGEGEEGVGSGADGEGEEVEGRTRRAALSSSLPLVGRPNVKHFAAASRGVCDALERVLRASPSSYPLVVLGGQPDYHRSLVEVASAGAQGGYPEAIVEDSVRRLAASLRVCASARTPVLVVFGPGPSSAAALAPPPISRGRSTRGGGATPRLVGLVGVGGVHAPSAPSSVPPSPALPTLSVEPKVPIPSVSSAHTLPPLQLLQPAEAGKDGDSALPLHTTDSSTSVQTADDAGLGVGDVAIEMPPRETQQKKVNN